MLRIARSGEKTNDLQDDSCSDTLSQTKAFEEPPGVRPWPRQIRVFRFSKPLLGMDLSGLYDYDGFRESRKERPHADRLCPGLHRRAVARPPARRPEGGWLPASLHGQGLDHESPSSRPGGGCLSPPPP